jgi:hypothetical protein
MVRNWLKILRYRNEKDRIKRDWLIFFLLFMPFKQRFQSFDYVLVRSSWRLQIFVFFLYLNWKLILVFCLLAFYVFSTFVWKLILFLTVDLVYILTGTLFTIQRSESVHRRRDKLFFLKAGASSWIQEPRISFFFFLWIHFTTNNELIFQLCV